MKSLNVVVLSIVIGCGGGSKDPATPANQGSSSPTTNTTTDNTTTTTAPAGSKFACHLNCSGQEQHGYGATEEEARTDVTRFVKSTCKPEDGQYFIVCNPVP